MTAFSPPEEPLDYADAQEILTGGRSVCQSLTKMTQVPLKHNRVSNGARNHNRSELEDLSVFSGESQYAETLRLSPTKKEVLPRLTNRLKKGHGDLF